MRTILHSAAVVLGARLKGHERGRQKPVMLDRISGVLLTCYPIEELQMRQQSSFSSHFGRISNSFATNFYCTTCEAERLMMISAIESARVSGRDKVVYQCTECGSEKTEIAMVYRTPIGTPGERR
jgi:hypothetical protein